MPSRFWMDPFAEQPTLCLIGNAVDPITKEGMPSIRVRWRMRAESYLKFTGLADTAYFGPEAEFFVFDSVKFHNEQHSAGYTIDSDEGHWNSGRDANEFQGSNLGYRIRPKEGYVPVPPTDSLSDLRSEISLTLGEVWRHGRMSSSRSRDRRSVRNRLPFFDPAGHGRQSADLQIRRSQYCLSVWQGGDVHAEAAVRRQRFGNALSPVAVEGREAAVCRRWICRTFGDGALLHRRAC